MQPFSRKTPDKFMIISSQNLKIKLPESRLKKKIDSKILLRRNKPSLLDKKLLKTRLKFRKTL
jgi:hypothetical protein